MIDSLTFQKEIKDVAESVLLLLKVLPFVYILLLFYIYGRSHLLGCSACRYSTEVFCIEMIDVICRVLYQILSDKLISKNAVSVLIACNKHDHALAKGARLIQTALEKEL